MSFDFKKTRERILEILKDEDTINASSTLLVLAWETAYNEGCRTWEDVEEMARPAFDKLVQKRART